MEINKTYKLRIYPNKAQEQKLLQILGCCRFVYNRYLAQAKEGKFNYYEMSKDLTKFRYTLPWLAETQLEPLEQALRRLNISYNRFFRKISKYPNFKSKKDIRQSFQKHHNWRIRDNKIQIQQDLVIKFRGTTPVGKLGTLVVSRHVSGKWFATMTAKVEVKTPRRYTKPIGIDLGLNTLATLSTGQKYANVAPQKTLQIKLTKAQRALAKKQKGSKRREKARKEVARIYEKITNIRQNHLHQVSHAITAKNHSLIAVEDLNVKGMMQNGKLARSLGDASFRELLRQIKYKQEWKGGEFVTINRFFPSSKTCNFCQFIIETLPLSVRTWECEKCGTTHDRDINAAKNIVAEAVKHTERGEMGSSISMKRSRAKGTMLTRRE